MLPASGTAGDPQGLLWTGIALLPVQLSGFFRDLVTLVALEF